MWPKLFWRSYFKNDKYFTRGSCFKNDDLYNSELKEIVLIGDLVSFFIFFIVLKSLIFFKFV